MLGPPTSTTATDSSARTCREPRQHGRPVGGGPGIPGRILRRPGRRQRELVEPGADRRRITGGVFGQQMAGQFVSVQHRLRQAVLQVPEVDLAEDRITRSPQQQRRHLERRECISDRVQGGMARMCCGKGDVGHELADRKPAAPGPVGRREGVPHRRRKPRPGQRGGHPHEQRRPVAGDLVQQRPVGQPDQDRPLGTGALMDGRVGQYHSAELIPMPERPAE